MSPNPTTPRLYQSLAEPPFGLKLEVRLSSQMLSSAPAPGTRNKETRDTVFAPR